MKEGGNALDILCNENLICFKELKQLEKLVLKLKWRNGSKAFHLQSENVEPREQTFELKFDLQKCVSIHLVISQIEC